MGNEGSFKREEPQHQNILPWYDLWLVLPRSYPTDMVFNTNINIHTNIVSRL